MNRTGCWNNLKEVTARFPAGHPLRYWRLAQGSPPWSTVFRKTLAQKLNAPEKPGKYKTICRCRYIDRLDLYWPVETDNALHAPIQLPIGVLMIFKYPFAQTNEAKIRGHKKAALVSTLKECRWGLFGGWDHQDWDAASPDVYNTVWSLSWRRYNSKP